mmetsp:Transcript_10351/g.20835  ORF Transcript_10351/g.20835 Transcript_10351/m.20835 type:complete len:213 (+) Transcript_10351:1177-1815(+)
MCIATMSFAFAMVMSTQHLPFWRVPSEPAPPPPCPHQPPLPPLFFRLLLTPTLPKRYPHRYTPVRLPLRKQQQLLLLLPPTITATTTSQFSTSAIMFPAAIRAMAAIPVSRLPPPFPNTSRNPSARSSARCRASTSTRHWQPLPRPRWKQAAVFPITTKTTVEEQNDHRHRRNRRQRRQGATTKTLTKTAATAAAANTNLHYAKHCFARTAT